MRDTIHINDLFLALAISDEDFKDYSILLSLKIPYDISVAAHSDDLAHSINYAAVYKTLVEALRNTCHPSLEALTDRVFGCLFATPGVDEANIILTVKDIRLRFTMETTRRRDPASTGLHKFTLNGLGFRTIIGVDPLERFERQLVLFDITVDRQQRSASQGQFPFIGLSESIRQKFEPSEYLTIEALASAVACHVLKYTEDPDDIVRVKLSKPDALQFAASAQVQITRRRSDFPYVFSQRGTPQMTMQAAHDGSSLHSVALALGSNLGDRFANIETALRLLEIPRSLLTDLPENTRVSVVDTSFMYETAPMYVTDQPRFANCACMIETNLPPSELLRVVKEVEKEVGRVPSVRYGPRAVDLDILIYGDRLLDTRPLESRSNLDNLIGELVIPHPRLCEREFVLRPLNDMIPDFIHPACNKTLRTLLDELVSTQTENDFPMFKVMPFPKYSLDTKPAIICGIEVLPTAKYWTISSTVQSTQQQGQPYKTRIMATLNVTPDSFSDGAQHSALPAAVTYATAAVASGADIIDIGGHSTRPGADYVSPEEEIARVVPVIQAIRTHANNSVRDALISVDTFRWEVAERAVRAGANCINDVYAFTGPTYPPDAAAEAHLVKMRGVARGLGVPVVLMHSRGDAGANKNYTAYSGGLVSAIQAELGRKVDAIVRGSGGVRRWLVTVDPGIGFSKTVKGQLALMRDQGKLTAGEPGNALAGYPLLFGASKKSVLGAVLERPDVDGVYKGRKTTAQERGWATAAAVACAVQQGASVVRVHDVAEMRDVVAVASAIWN